MRTVIQRVTKASVSVEETIISSIQEGLLILVGIEDADNEEDIDFLCKKITQLRIFDDKEGIMNESILEKGGEILAVSQFTLHASTKKGNRPSYIKASKSEFACPMYQQFCHTLSGLLGKEVQTGAFGQHMKISLINDGPVTIIIDSKNKE